MKWNHGNGLDLSNDCYIIVVHQLEALQREEKPTDEIKARLDEISEENRFLQSKLTDAQTKLALLRCELATTKQTMEEKCYELQQ